MPEQRQHRRNFNDPGHAHSLTFSCYKGFKFLQAERTCHFDLWAYVFMPEHVHLLIHPRDSLYDMAKIRKAIKSPIGSQAIKFLARKAPEWIPKITRLRGKKSERLFWQSGGGYDRNVVEPKTLMHTINYIHMNPVRRDLVEQSEEWKWSSANWYINMGEIPIAVDPIPPAWLEGV